VDFNTTDNQDIDTRAGFVSVDYKLSSAVTARASARYTLQDRSFNGCLSDPGDGEIASAFNFLSEIDPFLKPAAFRPGECVTFNADGTQAGLIRSSLNQNNVSWRAGLDWKVDSNTLLYGNITKGYKAGGFDTEPAVYAAQLAPVQQESLLAYEVGFKTRFDNPRIQLDGALFYYDYTNKQIQDYVVVPFFGNLPGLITVPKSSVEGAELDVTFRPINALRMSFGGTYLHSRVDTSDNVFDPFGAPIDIRGEQFPDTPKWQLTADAQYDFPITDAWSGYVGGDISYRTTSFAAFGDNAQFLINGYALLGLRAGVESDDGHWRVEVWGKNVTDQYYWVNTTHVIDTIARSAGMPATYGLNLAYHL
jgi:outer membrane receptor protein involved in Fe transport